MPNNSTPHQKVMLIVLDGWGLYKEYPGNAITLANTPFFDQLWETRPTAVLEASGESVGLPEGQMGTSEVNHFTIGAGRVEFQDLVRINKAMNDGSLAANPVLQEAFAEVKKRGSRLHFIGLLSDGGVHSHQEHLFAMIRAAADAGVAESTVVHPITDGRDTSTHGARRYVQQLQTVIQETNGARIGSLGGRYYAMDRDHNWVRTDMYYHMLTKGEAETFSTPEKALEASYAQNITDEHVKPCLIEAPAGTTNLIQEHDVVIITNFRNDRPRQITERFLHQGPEGIWLATMTQYNPDYQTNILFEPQPKPVSMGQIISDAGLRQLRITETEKFPHMTFFINCQHQQPFEKEDRTMFDSYSDIPTHDKRPAMRTPDVARAIVDDIRAEKHEVIFTNLCNADMLGHTGNIPAAIEGCETVDAALSSIVPTALEYGFSIIVIADHGNADQMLDEETGELITSHSLNPVPFILVSGQYSEIKRKSGTLIDIAPTILTMLGLPVPQEMTGESFVG